jgi:hypothetical protein
MVDQTEEQKAALNEAARIERAEFLAKLEKLGYDIQMTLEILEDEVFEYAENNGYHFCDDCDQRMGDPSDNYNEGYD